VRDRVTAVAHGLGLTVGRRHRAGIEVIAPDHDRRPQLTGFHHVVETHADLRSLAVTEPADSSRKALELDALPCQPQPAVNVLVVGQGFHDRAVGAIDVVWGAAHPEPPEWALHFAKQWPV